MIVNGCRTTRHIIALSTYVFLKESAEFSDVVLSEIHYLFRVEILMLSLARFNHIQIAIDDIVVNQVVVHLSIISSLIGSSRSQLAFKALLDRLDRNLWISVYLACIMRVIAASHFVSLKLSRSGRRLRLAWRQRLALVLMILGWFGLL